eukprot:scaffold15670_cov112-Isochrysis_galbana.AAC.1
MNEEARLRTGHGNSETLKLWANTYKFRNIKGGTEGYRRVQKGFAGPDAPRPGAGMPPSPCMPPRPSTNHQRPRSANLSAKPRVQKRIYERHAFRAVVIARRGKAAWRINPVRQRQSERRERGERGRYLSKGPEHQSLPLTIFRITDLQHACHEAICLFDKCDSDSCTI